MSVDVPLLSAIAVPSLLSSIAVCPALLSMLGQPNFQNTCPISFMAGSSTSENQSVLTSIGVSSRIRAGHLKMTFTSLVGCSISCSGCHSFKMMMTMMMMKVMKYETCMV